MSDRSLHDIAHPHVITVTPATLLQEALSRMESERISCLVVVDEGYRPVGIFTEQDAVHMVAGGRFDGAQAISGVMTHPVQTLPGNMEFHDAFQLMSNAGHRHLVVVDDQGKLAGIASETDFYHHLSVEYLAELKTVAAAMRLDVPTLTEDTDLAKASQVMAERRQGCVVVVRGDQAVGILTERDIVRLAREIEDPNTVKVAAVMRFPLLSVAPDSPLQEATRLMDSRATRRLVVIDEGRLVGLITQHDIALALETRHLEYLIETVERQQVELTKVRQQATDLALIRDQHIQLQVLMHAFDASANAIVITDASAKILWTNPAFSRLSGYDLTEVMGHTPGELLRSGQQDQPFYKHLWDTILSGQVWHGELVNKNKSGKLYHEELTITPVRVGGNEITHFIAIQQDITQRKSMESQLRDSQLLFASVANSVPALIWMTGPTPGCTWFNESWLAFTGRTLEQETGYGWTAHIHPEDLPERLKKFNDGFEARQAYALEYRLRRHDGEYRWMLGQARPRLDASGQFAGYVGSCLDVTEHKNLQLELAHLASTDFLTGLSNRRHFLEQMDITLARFHRHGPDTALIMLDLDHFKQVNDDYGHAAGDEALRHFSELIRAASRRVDLLGRLGGEEFAILMPDTTGEGAMEYAERLRLALESNPPRIGERSIPLTLSAGVTIFDATDASVDSILLRADDALYQAKRLGRNRVETIKI
jgi:diguanylate cyclase (GGDEF)-like protein/PAS domain S-box-containing protein